MKAWLECRRFLAVRLDNSGDVVMLEPALRAIKRGLPDASITLLATPAGAAASSLITEIDGVITWRPIWQDTTGETSLDPGVEAELVEILRERRFDAAFIFTSFSQTPHTPGYVCGLAGIPLRAGASKEFGGGTLTLEVRDISDAVHQVDRNLALVEAAGFETDSNHVRIRVGSASEARRILRQSGLEPERKFVVVHPGASAEARRYDGSRFALVAERLVETGVQVIVTGVERERRLLNQVGGAGQVAGGPMGEGRMAIRTDLTMLELATLISTAAAVVCNNSLPIHLADATETPAVCLYSGTDLETQWEPRFTRHKLLRRPTLCHPCYLLQCPIGKPCLDIQPSIVVDAVTEVMQNEHRTKMATGMPKPRDGRSGQRVAAFRALYLGDMLLAVPAFRALRQLFPSDQITLIGLGWSQALLVRFSRYLDRFVEFPGYLGIAEREYEYTTTESWLQEQREYGYDIAIQMHGSGLTSNRFVRELGASTTVGHHPINSPALELDLSMPFDPHRHEIDRSLDLVGLLKPGSYDRRLEFPVRPEDLAEVDQLLPRDSRRLAVIHPGAKSSERRWPVARFAQLADHLGSERGYDVVLTGTENEVSLCDEVVGIARTHPANLAGRTSLGGLAGLISTANLFIGNDSGPSHLAEAVMTPSLTLFGPAEPEQWGPADTLRHRSLRRKDESGAWQVSAISIDEAIWEIDSLEATEKQPQELVNSTRRPSMEALTWPS